MTELANRKNATHETPDLDDAQLLGFERLGSERGEEKALEEAAGLALNKRGDGEVPVSDLRLKSHVKPVGQSSNGLNLYSFRYVGEEQEFRGVMAQELLADSRHSGAVEIGAGGFYRVDYARLGLQNLVSEDMLAAGRRALQRVVSGTGGEA